MLIRIVFLNIIFLSISFVSFSQTTYVRAGGKEEWLLNRMEIKLQANNDFNLSTVKPYMRKAYVRQTEIIDSLITAGSNTAAFSTIDQYNIDRFLANNTEYVMHPKESWKSKKPIWNTFFTSKGNLFEVNEKDFYLSVNPVILEQQSIEQGNDERLFVNYKGVAARGLIAQKIGFDFFLTDNQERTPLFVQDWVSRYKAVPGGGFYKSFKKTGYDFFDARGSVNWNVTKYINMQLGYDKNFIGNGYRSLFLSDFSNSYLFLKLNTRIWKINYTNLYQELFPAFIKRGDNLLPRKYAAMHHFSINATPWLNVGLFESVVFGRKDHFDFSYLLPVIFLRSIEGENGSPDNANIGFDAKVNIAKKVQVYGQLMLDEFVLKNVLKHKDWWANKQAYQFGVKYVDAFNVSNLDLQLELNNVRPFTYAHHDSVADYSHYNQPLAHPLGANFREIVFIAKYQPLKKLYLQGKMIYYKQGTDSAGYDFGSNIFRNYEDRLRDYGYYMFQGVPATCLNLSFNASYEIKENLFIDGTMMYRKYSSSGTNNTTKLFTIGLRWNMFRREYDY